MTTDRGRDLQPPARRLLSALRNDVVLQWRHRFYHVYAIVTAVYVATLYFVPRPAAGPVAALVIVSDPAILGLLFVAAIVLFERDDRVLQGLSVSPLRPGEYVAAKAASLTVLALGASLVLATAAWLAKGATFDPLLLVVGVGLTGLAFSLIGLALVVRCESLSRFLPTAILAELVLSLPGGGYFGLLKSPALYLLPTLPAMNVIGAAFGVGPGGKGGGLVSGPAGGPAFIWLSVAALAGWTVVLYFWARSSYVRFVVRGGGAGR